MNDAKNATEALEAAVSGRPGGRATEFAMAYLRLARRPVVGSETGGLGRGSDPEGTPAKQVLDALSNDERRLLRAAIDDWLAEQRVKPVMPPHDDEMVSPGQGQQPALSQQR